MARRAARFGLSLSLFAALFATFLVAAGPGFRSKHQFDDHWSKHGREFGGITKAQYLGLAQELRDAKVGGPILEAIRKDGVATRYDQQTGAFIAFNPNGVIRTFFRPNDGERYWRRQAERGE